MGTELQKAITEWIFEHEDEFSLINATVNYFSNYIYDDNGNFLIGGEDVHNFICEFIKLIDNYKNK